MCRILSVLHQLTWSAGWCMSSHHYHTWGTCAQPAECDMHWLKHYYSACVNCTNSDVIYAYQRSLLFFRQLELFLADGEVFTRVLFNSFVHYQFASTKLKKKCSHVVASIPNNVHQQLTFRFLFEAA